MPTNLKNYEISILRNKIAKKGFLAYGIFMFL